MYVDFKRSEFVCHNLKVAYPPHVFIYYLISYQFSFYYLQRHISHCHPREIDPEGKCISLQRAHHL